MAIIISIETSTPACSVAIHDNERLLAKELIQKEQSHSSILNDSIGKLLNRCQIHLSDINALAISKGPGSYTGLRIGTSTAKGLCYALDIPLIGINTLQAMAHGVNKYNVGEAFLSPMLDARRMEVYTMLFNSDMTVVKETTPLILNEDSMRLFCSERKVLFFGDGARKIEESFLNAESHIIEGIIPDAEYVGELAHIAYENGRFEDLAYFEPFYLKEFMATKPKSML